MELPILAFEAEILQSVKDNNVTIIVAETGAGKSTQVPQFLLKQGYRVLVTEPRRLAARRLAERVAEEMNVRCGSIVGFRTAYEAEYDSIETRCLYCTDGLALVRELLGSGRYYDVLIIDELHEWNVPMELLIGWVKRKLMAGAPFKLVIMSATIEAEALAEYFDGANLIRVPGRLFPIVDYPPGRSIELDVKRLVELGRSVLVFQPGKSEIAETLLKLREFGVNAELLPLHRELPPDEQDRCFQLYDRPKVVVATNIAETSLTVPGINAVVDSGLERQMEVCGGIERLLIGNISLAKSRQRRGRAGRTEEGVYIDHCRAKNRPEYPVPEIQRLLLDQPVLRLEIAGVRLEDLELFHQPSAQAMSEARELLVELGCLSSESAGNYQVTDIGYQVASLPLSAAVARMVVEGVRRGVASDVVIVAAIIEVRSIVDRKRNEWKRFCIGATESDLLAQVAVYKAMASMVLEKSPDVGLDIPALTHAREIVENISARLGVELPLKSSGKSVDVLRAVALGLCHKVYVGLGDRRVARGDDVRVIPAGSFYVPRKGSYLVGVPFDLQLPGANGRAKELVRMVTLASRIDLSWIKFNPDDCRPKKRKQKRNAGNERCCSPRMRNTQAGCYR